MLIFLLIPYLSGPSLRSLSHIVRELQGGDTTNFAKLLAGILAAWILLPLMANDSYLNITPGHLTRFPLPAGKRFLLECSGIIIQPITWLIGIGSFSLLVPLIFLPAPLINVLNGLFFIIFSFFFSIFLKNFFYETRGIKKFLFLFTLTPLFFGTLYFAGREFVNAAFLQHPLPGLPVMAFLSFFSLYIAFKSFLRKDSERKKMNERTGEKILFKFIKFPGKIGFLLQKDFYYFLNNKNILTVIFLLCLYFYYYVTADLFVIDSFMILFLFIFIPNITFALNSFGFESGAGITRYTLFPLKGYEILLAKNLAFLSIVIIQVLPVFVLILLEFGTYIFLLGFIEMLTTALLLLAWGNIISVLQPVGLQFHRLNLVSLQTAISYIISIYIIHIGVFRSLDTYRQNLHTAWSSQLLFLLACFTLYFASLINTGKKLENNMERIKEQLK